MESKEIFTWIWIWDLPCQLAIMPENGPKTFSLPEQIYPQKPLFLLFWNPVHGSVTAPHKNWGVFRNDLFSESFSKSVFSHHAIS